MKCKFQHDDGHICGKEMTKRQYKQDGICSSCAEWLWEWFRTEIYGLPPSE